MTWPISYDEVFRVNKHNFNETALKIFRFQVDQNAVYSEYLSLLDISPDSVKHWSEIPFLPIEFFKSHTITSGEWQPKDDQLFESSATTGTITSKHFYTDITWYNKSFLKGFKAVYGDPSEWCILALLPNYLEREHSSLIAMTNALIDLSNQPSSGFYLYDHDGLKKQLEVNENLGQKTLLIGVSYALLDFSAKLNGDFQHLTVLETGGMKGRRKEIIRSELHAELAKGFGTSPIHSEYGMTELFSQAYSTSNQRFTCPPWMRVDLTQIDDPFGKVQPGKNGRINVIDLANVQSCSFIATSDIGRMHKDGTFEVLGRFDHSEQRGCNLMLA